MIVDKGFECEAQKSFSAVEVFACLQTEAQKSFATVEDLTVANTSKFVKKSEKVLKKTRTSKDVDGKVLKKIATKKRKEKIKMFFCKHLSLPYFKFFEFNLPCAFSHERETL
ncbi:hypothetical protein Avbf_06091 [Armadillidium vulgare]|nr:hypothetical protein Avbf_06091 [Armadillidium vulgare]